jgi:hypothetical protein
MVNLLPADYLAKHTKILNKIVEASDVCVCVFILLGALTEPHRLIAIEAFG